MTSEHVKLDDTVRFGVNTYAQASGDSINAEVVPRWFVYEDGGSSNILNGAFTVRDAIFDGTYQGTFGATAANGFEDNKYYSVIASGKVQGQTAFGEVKNFVVGDIYDANIVQVSGASIDKGSVSAFHAPPSGVADAVYEEATSDHNTGGTFGALFNALDSDIYFAAIKYVLDGNNAQDEFGVQWYRNDVPVTSGELTLPYLNVHKVSDGTNLIINQPMAHASILLGVVNHFQSPVVMVSGEPYLVTASGVIDSVNRVWSTVVGIDII